MAQYLHVFLPSDLLETAWVYTSSVLAEEEALEANARSEVRNTAWVEIYCKDAGTEGAVRNVSLTQELKTGLNQHLSDVAGTVR